MAFPRYGTADRTNLMHAVLKARPAKVATVPARVLQHRPATQLSAARLVDHVQVLVFTAPAVVHVLERWAERFRHRHDVTHAEAMKDAIHQLGAPVPIKEFPMVDRLEQHPEDAVADAETAQRLVDLIHAITPERPVVVAAMERCLRALLVMEVRQRVVDRLPLLSPEDLATLDAMTLQMVKNRERDQR